MPVSPAPTKLLVVGGRAQWPKPLAQLLADGVVWLDCVSDLHQAAARLASARGPNSQGYRAILIDPDHLTRREIGSLEVLKRHVALPICSLPSARNRKDLLRLQGILSWEEAVATLMPLQHNRFTPQGAQGSSTFLRSPASLPISSASPLSPPAAANPFASPARTDNPPRDEPEDRAEIPVASKVAARYDALVDQPILSESERRALLGSAD